MDYKNIEKKLSIDAKNVEQKDFSARWAEIQLRDEGNLEIRNAVADSVLVEESATPTNEVGKINTHLRNVKIIVAILATAIVLVLAIVLPLTLKSNEKVYYNEEQLNYKIVEESEFISAIEQAQIKIVNTSKYSLENYRLYYLEKDEVKGGGFDFIDESLGCFANVVFYDSSINVKDIFTNYEIYEVKGTPIKYILHPIDGYYVLSATTVFDGIYYRFACNIVENNIDDIFDKFFN